MSYSLGIDIGTSKIAAVIIDTVNGAVADCASVKTCAVIPAAADGFAEQDTGKIMSKLQEAVTSLAPRLRQQVAAVGFTGQMHGVTLWNEQTVSPLYTWQDKRASATGMLEHIRNVSGHAGLQDGYGAVTLAWLAEKNLLKEWRHAATIHDYAVASFCGLDRPLADAADAASWGLFDIYSGQWDRNAIRKLNIPEYLFPDPVSCGAAAGELSGRMAVELGLPASIPVMAATGDNQASILATALNPEQELYLTIGTGAQLSAILSRGELNTITIPPGVELRPYFDNSFLAVSATLSGGQSLLWLPNSINAWLRDLAMPEIPVDELFKRLDELADKTAFSGLEFKPNFNGERHNHELTGAISGIREDNFNLGGVFRSLVSGVLNNLVCMMPAEILKTRGGVVANGNAVRNLAIVRTLIPEVFGLPVRISEAREEAACGAAIMSFTHRPPAV